MQGATEIRRPARDISEAPRHRAPPHPMNRWQRPPSSPAPTQTRPRVLPTAVTESSMRPNLRQRRSRPSRAIGTRTPPFLPPSSGDVSVRLALPAGEGNPRFVARPFLHVPWTWTLTDKYLSAADSVVASSAMAILRAALRVRRSMAQNASTTPTPTIGAKAFTKRTSTTSRLETPPYRR